MTSTTIRRDYEVLSSTGQIVQTFNTRERAVAWAQANAFERGTLTVRKFKLVRFSEDICTVEASGIGRAA